MSRLNKVEDNVKLLLAEDERARNDDKYLIWKYIREIDGINMFIPLKDFDRMTSFESIRRCRQKLQSQGFCMPTDPSVVQKRRTSEREYRSYAVE